MSAKRVNKRYSTEKDYTKELMKMIKSFTRNELIILMQFAQKSRSGKKAELVERAINLVKENCDVSIQIKINEIYNQNCSRLKNQLKASLESKNVREKSAKRPSKRKLNISDFETDTSSSSFSDWYPTNLDSESSLSSTFSNLSESSSLLSKSSIPLQPANLKIKIKKSNIENMSITSISQRMPMAETSGSSTYLLPSADELNMIKLPFYDRISQIIKPTIMAKSGLVTSNVYNFLLSQEDISSIEKSKIWHADGLMEYIVQVLLRFAIKNTSVEQEDFFPPKMSLTVNNKVPALPALIPSTKIGVEPKRPNRPVNITPLLHFNSNKKNIINIRYEDVDILQDYVISVEISKQLSSSELLHRLNNVGPRSAQLTKNLIKEKMKATNDSEISATSLRISLSCPLSKMRLSIPVRSSSCSHLQCFDASTYIQMNEKKPSWMCPICDKPAKFDTLFIDGLFIEILSQVSDTNDVQFTDDGEWLPIFTRKVEKKQICDKIVTLISDSPEHTKEISMVDLTNSDDDDEENMPFKWRVDKQIFNIPNFRDIFKNN